MLRDLIPARYRKRVYQALTTLYAIELVLDLIPAAPEAEVLAIVGILGFALAAGNTHAEG